MTFDSTAFRAVLGKFATGVTVVTTCQGPHRHGITVNAFCSVSLDPPLVLICVERTSRVHDVLKESGVFAVNFLAENQEALSACFAGNSAERYTGFCGAASHVVATGAPVLDSCLGFVDCTIVDAYPGGDHTIFLGRVEALSSTNQQPLLYYHSQYGRLAQREDDAR
jgi:flavin reductase (DIM6/NTAB) family NADH-FMN oxidoreductase RutF